MFQIYSVIIYFSFPSKTYNSFSKLSIDLRYISFFIPLRRKRKQAWQCTPTPLFLHGVIHDNAFSVNLDLVFVWRPRLAFELLTFAHSDVSELGNLFHAAFAYDRNVYRLIDGRLAACALGIIQALASHSSRTGIAIAAAGGDLVLVFRGAFVASLNMLRLLACVQLADLSFILFFRNLFFYWLWKLRSGVL